MSQAGMIEQPDLPSEDPTSEFHDFINSQPNFRDKKRWEQEQYAIGWLNAASPTFRSLPSDSPTRQYKVEEFLNSALQRTPGEQIQHAAEDLGPAGLATVAGLGAATGGLGVIPTALAAGAAGAAGEFIPQLRPMTTGEAPPPWSESIGKAGTTAATFPLVDMGMHGVAKGVSAATRRMFVPHANDPGRQMGLEAIKEYGGVPGITQRGGGAVMQQLESIADAAIPGKGMAARRQQKVEDAVAEMTLATIRKATPIIRSDAETAELFFKESDNLRAFYEQEASRRYQVVDDLTQSNVGVNMRPAMNLTAAGVGPGKKYPGMNPTGAPKTVTDDPATAELFRQFKVEALRDPQTYAPLTEGYSGHEGFFALANKMGKGQASFSDAQRMSSALKKIARENPDHAIIDPIKRDAGKLAGRMARVVDHEMDKAANDFTHQSVQALVNQGIPLAQAQAQVRNFSQEYKDAKTFFRENVAERFEDETFRGLAAALKDEPAKFSRLAMAADSPGKLKALRESAPNMWPEMQGRILRSIYDDARPASLAGVGLEIDELIMRGLAKPVDGKALATKFHTLGVDYVKELTSGQVGLPDIQRLGAAIERSMERGEGQGKTVVMLAQGGAAVSLALTPFGAGFMAPGKAAMVMITPNILSAVLSNKPILDMMERGLLGGPKSEAGAKFAAFVLAEHMKETRNELREKEHLSQPANQLPNPVGPALSQAPIPPPPALPQVPQLPRLGQQRLVGQPPNFR